MRQSIAQLERAFVEEVELDRVRRDRLRRTAATRSRVRTIQRRRAQSKAANLLDRANQLLRPGERGRATNLLYLGLTLGDRGLSEFQRADDILSASDSKPLRSAVEAAIRYSS